MLFRLCAISGGVVVLGLTMWQIFDDLFHPTAHGSLSDLIARAVWRLMHRRDTLLASAGPISLIVVITTWTLLIVLGFASIYWPLLLSDFRFSAKPEGGFAVAAYFSLEALTTLGLGEIAPITPWLRFVVTFEALLGLGLVTACVSWLVLLYPALSRMRSLSRQAILLKDAAEQTGVAPVATESDVVLIQLTEHVVRTRVDLVHFPILYYFYATRSELSLANALPVLLRFSDEGQTVQDGERVRLSASMLKSALEDLTDLLNRRFLGARNDNIASVMDAFVADHSVG